MQRINLCLSLVLIVILTSCGFHLRGYNYTSYKFPFKSVYVKCENVIICNNLNTMIKTDDLAKLESKPELAEVTLRVYGEQTNRDAQSFNAAGRISGYLLTYQVQAQIIKKGERLGQPIEVSVQSSMQYNDATILSDNQEEALFWDNLHQSATTQLVRQIVYFKYVTPNDNESE